MYQNHVFLSLEFKYFHGTVLIILLNRKLLLEQALNHTYIPALINPIIEAKIAAALINFIFIPGDSQNNGSWQSIFSIY